MKLTAKQQEVVNLMAAGYELTWHQGIRCDSSCSLFKGQSRRAVPANIGSQLEAKGVVKSRSEDWGSHYHYKLTALGKRLSLAIEKPKTTTWWKVSKWSDMESGEFVDETSEYLIHANGRKEKKIHEYAHWFPSKALAVNELRKRLAADISEAKQTIREAEKQLKKLY